VARQAVAGWRAWMAGGTEAAIMVAIMVLSVLGGPMSQ
jgi:hypothetical protein